MTEIVAHIFGGLGNQLFQYTAARSVLLELGAQRVSILQSNNIWSPDHPTLVDLVPSATPAMAKRYRLLKHAFARLPLELPMLPTSALRTRIALAGGVFRVGADGAFSPRPNDLPVPEYARSVLMDGYFQHPSWYVTALASTLDEISKSAPPDLHDISRQFGESTAVVSFRASDYVRLGWQLPRSYYVDAVSLLRDSGVEQVVVNCENRDFGEAMCKWLATAGIAVIDNPLNSGRGALDDFWCAVASRKNVMSNSTFSWWTVMVGSQLRKSTVSRSLTWAPSPWLPGVDFPCIQSDWRIVKHCGFVDGATQP